MKKRIVVALAALNDLIIYLDINILINKIT